MNEKTLGNVARRGGVKFVCLLLNIALKILESCDRLILKILLPLWKLYWKHSCKWRGAYIWTRVPNLDPLSSINTNPVSGSLLMYACSRLTDISWILTSVSWPLPSLILSVMLKFITWTHFQKSLSLSYWLDNDSIIIKFFYGFST